MKTITKTFELFTLSELSAKAQQEAFDNWLSTFEYGWNEENRETLNVFCSLFDVVCSHWQYDACTYHFNCSTNHSQIIEELKGQRLATYINNHYWHELFPAKLYWKHRKSRKSRIIKDTSCSLTGYFMDDCILQPMYDFLRQPDENINFINLMNQCLEGFFSACRDDVSDRESEDNFKSESEINEWEYLADGKIFN